VVVLLVLPQPTHKIVILNVVKWTVWSVIGLHSDRAQRVVVVVLTLVIVLSLQMLHVEVLHALTLAIPSHVILAVAQWIV